MTRDVTMVSFKLYLTVNSPAVIRKQWLESLIEMIWCVNNRNETFIKEIKQT